MKIWDSVYTWWLFNVYTSTFSYQTNSLTNTLARSWLKNGREICFPEEIWTTIPWNWKPVCLQWALQTHKLKFGALDLALRPIPSHFIILLLFSHCTLVWVLYDSFVCPLYMCNFIWFSHFLLFKQLTSNLMPVVAIQWILMVPHDFKTHYSFLFISVCPSGSLYIQPVSLYA